MTFDCNFYALFDLIRGAFGKFLFKNVAQTYLQLVGTTPFFGLFFYSDLTQTNEIRLRHDSDICVKKIAGKASVVAALAALHIHTGRTD